MIRGRRSGAAGSRPWYNPPVIKARPEDFIVEEKADLPLSPGGRFAVYRLRKSHWNTADLAAGWPGASACLPAGSLTAARRTNTD
jgi:hypothetical protein